MKPHGIFVNRHLGF